VAVQVPRKGEAQAVVAEALTRLRGDLERLIRKRFPALDAGDVYQRAALRALEHFREVRDQGRVDAWLRRIVVTSALDVLREQKGREVILAEPPDLASPAVADEACACTLALIGTLPEPYADMLRRIDIEEADLDEVASALNIAKGNAAVRLHRARRALRGRLREHCGVESLRQCLTCVCNERGCCATG
jgi:RNA polymerase sigma-70 factor (ECF subfamily)